MIEKDTIRLLRECDAGVKMGIQSIDDVLDRVESPVLKARLDSCKQEHVKLEHEIRAQLNRFNDDGKDPGMIPSGMARMKTNMMLAMKDGDHTIADLMTDGCGMGVKSLNKYLNQYEAADERSKDISKRLINLEEKLIIQMRDFL